MDYGTLKTAYFADLGPLAESVSVFEFGQKIDAAEIYFLSLLPPDMIPDMIITEEIVSGAGGAALIAEYEVPYAGSNKGFQLVDVRWDKVDYSLNHLLPTMMSGIKKDPAGFFLAFNETTDNLYCEVAGGYLMSSAPGTHSTRKTSLVSYKSIPTGYLSGADFALDTVEPDLGTRWHQLMLDYALSQTYLKFGKLEASLAYTANIEKRLQALGITELEQQK